MKFASLGAALAAALLCGLVLVTGCGQKGADQVTKIQEATKAICRKVPPYASVAKMVAVAAGAVVPGAGPARVIVSGVEATALAICNALGAKTLQGCPSVNGICIELETREPMRKRED